MADASTTKIDFTQLPTVVAVVGSRDYPRLDWVDRAIGRMNLDTVIVSGGARGVDLQAKQSAKKYKLRYKEFAVDSWEWNVLGKRVAYVRNINIISYVVGFGGHILIFAIEQEHGKLTPGSQQDKEICQAMEANYTIINHKGDVIWTTSAHSVSKP